MICRKCGSELLASAKFCNKCGTKVIQITPPPAPKAEANTAASRIGTVWPEWKIEEKSIGKGSFGEVFKAVRRDHNVESWSAIKVISIPNDASEIESLRSEGLDMNGTRTYLQGVVNDFVGEIQLMESLKGIQNIVSVEDYKVVEKTGEIGWDIYIRMELLTSFNNYIRGQKLTEADIIKLGCDICSALEICAKRNIIHRDIKPENIFINSFGDFKLGDFGIARKMENLTGGLSQKGTYNYMAPEVAKSGDYDARVDTYSLGIVLYRMLNCGRLPFIDSTKQVMTPAERKLAVDRRLNGEALPAPAEASPAMADLILRACAYDPAQRFASASEMKNALISVANGTYQLPAENTNATTFVRKAPADVNNNAPADNNAVQPLYDHMQQKNGNNDQNVKTFGEEPKKKKSMAPVIIAVILAVLVLAAAAVFIVPKFIGGSDTEQPASDTEQVAEDSFSRADKKKINDIITDAEALATGGDYKAALAKIEEGLTHYPQSTELKEKKDAYTLEVNKQLKDETLAEADALAEAGDYAGAIELIKNAQKEQGDNEEFRAALEKYAAADKEAAKTSAIATAETLAQQKDYLGAYNAIQDALKIVGEDAELSEKAAAYADSYVTSVSAQVDELLAANDLAAAKTLVKDALKLFPNDATLKERNNELNSYDSVLLHTLTPINGGFSWNEGTPADPFESDYTGIKNYAILHESDHWKSSTFSTEYKIDKQYDILTFTVSPYSDFGQNNMAYIRVYADGSLRYTSQKIVQKTQPYTVNVDVSNAEYVKIVVQITSDHSCIMISDASLARVLNSESTYDDSYTSLSTLDTFNGGISWQNGYPENTRGDDYTYARNYALLHESDHWKSSTYSAEYYVNKQYSSLSFNIAPLSDFGANQTAYVKVYLDDVLIYTAPAITQKTEMFNTGEIDISDTTYLKIVVEITDSHACVILSDVLLKNK